MGGRSRQRVQGSGGVCKMRAQLHGVDTKMEPLCSMSQCVGGGEGLGIDLVRGSGVRGCAWRGHVARRLHKNGALNAADKNEKFET